MPNRFRPEGRPNQSVVYQIRIRGHVDYDWTEWTEGMTVTPQENGDTLLTGAVIDQAALHGMLRRLRDLGIPLVSIIPMDSGRDDAPDLSK